MDWLSPNPFSPNADWSRAYIDRLPDDAFLLVERDRATSRDKQGRSHPLDVRHLPVKNHLGRYSCPHIRNAIARANQVKGVGAAARASAKKTAERLYQRMCKKE